MKLITIILAMLLYLLPNIAYAGGNGEIKYNSIMGEIAKSKLGVISQNRSAVFYSQCKSQVNISKTTTLFRAILIVEVKTSKALLVVLYDNEVVNVATISIEKSGAVVEEANGGLYTYKLLTDLANELIRYGFYFSGSFDASLLNNIRTTYQCKNAE